MNFLHDDALKKPSDRRQFGKMTGGAAVLLAGAPYGAVMIAERGNAKTSVRTAFGKVLIIRVSRFPRLDAGGHSPAVNHMTAASVFGGRGTADFGRASRTEASLTSDGHGHGDAPRIAAWPQPVNLTWGDVLVLEADVYSTSPEPVLPVTTMEAFS